MRPAKAAPPPCWWFNTASLLAVVDDSPLPVADDVVLVRSDVVPVALPVLPVEVESVLVVPFSWNTPPAWVVVELALDAVDVVVLCVSLVVDVLDDEEDGALEDDLEDDEDEDEDEEEDEEDELDEEDNNEDEEEEEEEEEDDDDDDEDEDDEDDEPPLLLLLLLPSRLYTTMLAVPPLGTVTTQKLAPPAPLAPSALVTLKSLTLDAPISHGRPLQPPPGHSTRRPKVGFVLARPDDVYTGFQPIFIKVRPELTVLAPATYGLQLPMGTDELPQMQPCAPAVPGGLM